MPHRAILHRDTSRVYGDPSLIKFGHRKDRPRRHGLNSHLFIIWESSLQQCYRNICGGGGGWAARWVRGGWVDGVGVGGGGGGGGDGGGGGGVSCLNHKKYVFLTACAGYLLYVPFKTNNKTNIDQIDTRHHHGPQSFMSFTSGILCRVSKLVSLTTIRTIYIVTYTSNMCKRYSCLDSRHNSQIMNMILSCQYDPQAAPTLI